MIRAIATDERGTVWVEAHGPAGVMLAAIDSAGHLLGEAPLPERDPRVPLHVRGGRIYLIEADGLGVQSIVVLRASTAG